MGHFSRSHSNRPTDILLGTFRRCGLDERLGVSNHGVILSSPTELQQTDTLGKAKHASRRNSFKHTHG